MGTSHTIAQLLEITHDDLPQTQMETGDEPLPPSQVETVLAGDWNPEQRGDP